MLPYMAYMDPMGYSWQPKKSIVFQEKKKHKVFLGTTDHFNQSKDVPDMGVPD